MTMGRVSRMLLAGLVALVPACRAGDDPTRPAKPPLALRAALTFRSALQTQAVAADVHHLTFKLVSAADETVVAASAEATPPFASPVTLQLAAPPDGTYRLTVEAFGGAAATSSLSLAGALLSANTVTVTGNVPAYSTGTSMLFPAPLRLKSGGTVTANVTGAGTNRLDVSLLQGATTLSTVLYSPASFPVNNLAPGTYVLRATLYTAGGVVDRTLDSPAVTVGAAATGYAADGTFAIAF